MFDYTSLDTGIVSVESTSALAFRSVNMFLSGHVFFPLLLQRSVETQTGKQDCVCVCKDIHGLPCTRFAAPESDHLASRIRV